MHRYRIKWRAAGLDNWLDPNVGICHGADGPTWWCSGYRAGFDGEDKTKAAEFLKPFGQFLRGEVVEWGTRSEREIREMDENGNISVIEDEAWEKGIATCDVMWKAQDF